MHVYVWPRRLLIAAGLVMATGTGVVLAQSSAEVGQGRRISLTAVAGADARSAPERKDAVAPQTEAKRTSRQIRAANSSLEHSSEAGQSAAVLADIKGQQDLHQRLRSVDPEQRLASGSTSVQEDERWQKIQTVLRPASLIVLCEEFQRDLPTSQYSRQVKRIEASARHAIEIQRSAGLSGDFFEDAVGDDGYRESLRKAVRGDKDAAYGIALAYKKGSLGVAASARRTEQWLRFSAELGNGLASWELAKIYNRNGLVADAARFEQKALDLGYRPPPRLPTRGY